MRAHGRQEQTDTTLRTDPNTEVTQWKKPFSKKIKRKVAEKAEMFIVVPSLVKKRSISISMNACMFFTCAIKELALKDIF